MCEPPELVSVPLPLLDFQFSPSVRIFLLFVQARSDLWQICLVLIAVATAFLTLNKLKMWQNALAWVITEKL